MVTSPDSSRGLPQSGLPTTADAESLPAGLSTAEALRRRAEFGANETPDPKTHPLRLLLGKFIAPVPCLLEAAIVLQLVLGEYVEAAVIGVLLVFNAVLGFFHEGRAQATIAALKSRLALQASVRRDGAWKTLAAAEIVPGDIVKLTLGSVVAADVRLLSGSAHVTSAQQKAIFRVVVNLAAVNGVVAAAIILYGYVIGLPISEFIPLILLAVLATVPVALPATFTLATAIGAQKLTQQGVLPTRLSAVDEAASMDVLCTDKTGTLTRNELAVTAVRAFPGFEENDVLALAALASSEGGLDPVDRAVRAAAHHDKPLHLVRFVPFDPAVKTAEAVVIGEDGTERRVVKGAFATVAALCPSSSDTKAADALQRLGYRVLGVAVGASDGLRLAGLVALSDPPRPDAADCIAELRRLGVEVVIVTGDAPVTAGVVTRQVGVTGAVRPTGRLPDDLQVEGYSVFAGVLPEDKFHLVRALQRAGHTVGMCGDGANDAPALRQAQIGIAVSAATDVAKSAAGIVLTEPGLAGIVGSVREGRITFQRILTYTLRSIVNKVRQVLFLGVGLVMTGHPVLTPMLMVLSMITGDFLAMSATTDNVEPSPQPNVWPIGSLTVAGAIMGFFDLAFCTAILSVGKYWLGLPVATLQTLTLVTLVFNGQAVFYVVRERRRIWSSRPSTIVILASLADLLIIPTLAAGGILMAPLAIPIIGGIFVAAIALAFTLDVVKAAIFRHLKMV
jgi:H+-transporting ATPase